MKLIITLLVAGAVYLVYNRLYESLWKRRLTVDVFFVSPSACEGDTAFITETITNAKSLPIPMLKIRFSLKKGLSFSGKGKVSVSDYCYKSDIFTVLSFQNLTRTIPFICEKRGFYEITQIDALSTNFFSSFPLIDKTDIYTSFSVLPGKVDMARLSIPLNSVMGEVITKRFLPDDPFEFKGVREYRPFDSAKTINWRAFAKSDELKVNLHEKTTSVSVCVLLNLDSENYWQDNVVFEENIRICASLCHNLCKKGVPVSVISNGRDIDGDELSCRPGCGEKHSDKIMHSLARIDNGANMNSFMGKFKELLKDPNTVYVYISSVSDKPLCEAFDTLCKQTLRGTFIFSHHHGVLPPISCKNANIFYWEVDK